MACCTRLRNSRSRCCSRNTTCTKCEFPELRCGERSCREKCSECSLKCCYDSTFAKCSDKHFIIIFCLTSAMLIAVGVIYIVGTTYYHRDSATISDEQLEECSVSNPPSDADCCSTDDPLPIYLSIAGWCMLGAGIIGTGIVVTYSIPVPLCSFLVHVSMVDVVSRIQRPNAL